MAGLPRDGLYSTLWRTPSIRGQAILGLFAQLTQGAGPISLVLVTRASTGSLAIAGAVTAAMWIAVAVARPLQGRLIDARGSRLVMILCGPVHAAALIGLVVAAHAHAGAWSLVLLSVVAGIALPPVSAAMRVEWGKSVPAGERTAAYSLVYLTQEIALLTGPLIVAALIAINSAGLALSVAAAVTGVASVVFGALIKGGGQSHEPRARGPRRPSAAMPALLVASFLVGAILGSLQVATPALALSRGAPALGGVLIAALSVGGIAGALIYGGRRWTSDPSVRFLSLLCVIGIAATLLAIGPPLPVVAVGLALVGLGLNPVFTTASLLIDRHSGPRAAESFGWMSTAVGSGTALGSAAAGALAQGAGVLSAYLGTAVAAYVAVLIAVLARGRLGRVPADRNMSSNASPL
jgi:MFS family permease